MVYQWARDRIPREDLDQWRLDLLAPIPGISLEGKVNEELIEEEMKMFASFKRATGG